MDPQHLATRDNVTFAEAFLHDFPILSAILIAMLASWALTAAVKPWWPPLRPRKRLELRLFDVVVAGVLFTIAAWDSLSWKVLLSVALLVGAGSPFGYYGVTELLCWKWPSLRRFLSLKELCAPDGDNETGV